MSVLKHLRSVSQMEFYKNAINLRKELTLWLLKDFGTKRSTRTLGHVISAMEETDQKIVDDIFEKYGFSRKGVAEANYPQWFIDKEKVYLLKYMAGIVRHVTHANSIYPATPEDIVQRRRHQNDAIGLCYAIYQELQYILQILPVNVSRMEAVMDGIEREVSLLKGWRESDRKRGSAVQSTDLSMSMRTATRTRTT